MSRPEQRCCSSHRATGYTPPIRDSPAAEPRHDPPCRGSFCGAARVSAASVGGATRIQTLGPTHGGKGRVLHRRPEKNCGSSPKTPTDQWLPMSTVDRGLLPPELRGLRTFKVYQSDGQPLRPAVDSDSRKAYYKALNRLSKTVAELLESMGREDPRHHDTPAPQRSGLAVYVAETTAETEEARAALCDDAESRREREPISGGCWPPLAERMVRILFPPAESLRTIGS